MGSRVELARMMSVWHVDRDATLTWRRSEHYGVILDAIQRAENILLAAPREARDLDFI